MFIIENCEMVGKDSSFLLLSYLLIVSSSQLTKKKSLSLVKPKSPDQINSNSFLSKTYNFFYYTKSAVEAPKLRKIRSGSQPISI